MNAAAAAKYAKKHCTSDTNFKNQQAYYDSKSNQKA